MQQQEYISFVTTDGLRALNQQAAQNQRQESSGGRQQSSRVLNDEFINRLDSNAEAKHVVHVIVPKGSGWRPDTSATSSTTQQQQNQNLRIQFYCQMQGLDEPQQAWLDVNVADFTKYVHQIELPALQTA